VKMHVEKLTDSCKWEWINFLACGPNSTLSKDEFDRCCRDDDDDADNDDIGANGSLGFMNKIIYTENMIFISILNMSMNNQLRIESSMRMCGWREMTLRKSKASCRQNLCKLLKFPCSLSSGKFVANRSNNSIMFQSSLSRFWHHLFRCGETCVLH
jgi:hypothetical protein